MLWKNQDITQLQQNSVVKLSGPLNISIIPTISLWTMLQYHRNYYWGLIHTMCMAHILCKTSCAKTPKLGDFVTYYVICDTFLILRCLFLGHVSSSSVKNWRHIISNGKSEYTSVNHICDNFGGIFGTYLANLYYIYACVYLCSRSSITHDSSQMIMLMLEYPKCLVLVLLIWFLFLLLWEPVDNWCLPFSHGHKSQYKSVWLRCHDLWHILWIQKE